MPFYAKKPADLPPADPAPAGTHIARVTQFIHLGTIDKEYSGESKKRDEVQLTFELCNEKKEFKDGEGEKPFAVSLILTNSLHEKATLPKVVENITNAPILSDKEVDLFSLVGKACMVTVKHKTNEDSKRVYANVDSVVPLPKGFEAPAPVNPLVTFDVKDWDSEVFETLPKWIKERIQKSDEYKAMLNPSAESFDDVDPELASLENMQ